MIISLTQSQTITIQEARTAEIDTLTINRMVDLPVQKVVKVFIAELPTPVTLWEGDAYDAIGQWTDQDVIDRLNELYN
jgi:hypothetical protein